MIAPTLVVFAMAAVCLLLAIAYERRFTIERPPVGIFGLGDVLVLLGGVIVVPYVYLGLPAPLVVAILGLGASSILSYLLEPLLGRGWAAWAGGLLLVAADIWASTGPYLLRVVANDVVLLLVVVGLSNVWVQSGMRARDAAALGAGLAVYDLVFTAVLPTTDELFQRLQGFPLTPLVAWPVGAEGHWLGIGLGDLLVASTWALVTRKAFGRTSGLRALVTALITIGGLLAVVGTGLFRATVPVMSVLGPAMVVQYAWSARHGPERTMWHYLQVEPRRRARCIR